MYAAQRAELQQFSRRRATVDGKSEELARFSRADVLTVVPKNNNYYIYCSTDVEPFMSQLVRPLVHQRNVAKIIIEGGLPAANVVVSE